MEHLCRYAMRGLRWANILLPTAGGKTLALQGATHRLLQEGAKAVLLVAPQVTIEDAFAKGVVFCTKEGEEAIEIPEEFWKRFRDTKRSGESLRAWLQAPKGAALTTHALVAGLKPEDFPVSLRGVGLAIDELHHNGKDETKLAEVARLWLERGGFGMGGTATGWRTSRSSISPLGAPVYAMGYMAVAEEAKLPKRIRVHTIPVEGTRAAGVLLDDDYVKIAQAVAQGGRPTLLKVRRGTKENPVTDSVDRFVTELVKAGVARTKILVAVGEEVGEDVREALKQERDAAEMGYEHLTYQVIIACQRLMEGADWPPCSRVASVGVPDALIAWVQAGGRGLRSKWEIPNYPKGAKGEEDWRDTTQYLAFVPAWPDDLAQQRKEVQRLMLYACALDTSDIAYDYLRFWSDLVTNARLPPVKAGLRAQIRTFADVDVQTLADARLLGVEAMMEVQRIFGQEGTLKNVVGLTRRWAGKADVRVLEQLILRAAAASGPLKVALHAKIAEVLAYVAECEVAQTLRDEDGVVGLLRVYEDRLLIALLELVDVFGDVVIPPADDIIPGFTGVLDKEQVTCIVTDMTAARNKAFDMSDAEVVEKVIMPYEEKYLQAPAVGYRMQNVSQLVGSQYTLEDLDRLLKRSAFSLAQLVACRDKVVGPVDVDAVRPQVARMVHTVREHHYADANAISLNRRSPKFKLKGGEDAVTLTLAAWRGWRGFPGGQGLREALGL